MRGPDPVAVAAAVVIASLAAAATAARGPSPWWAVPVFLGMVLLVLGVHALLSWRTRPAPPREGEEIRRLVRALSAAAGELRARSLGVRAADSVAGMAAGVVEAGYQLAWLAVERESTSAAAALAKAVAKLEDVAGRVDDPAVRLNVLIEELIIVQSGLESATRGLRGY
ncbi:hypothetical protein ACFPM7_12880 [Actinokineospora guangxiensis]|uniref:Uncharacterized protein n=1 Tax=Actinokineospora guangxiensis TaxID=1490288 RepID=A0ABW0EKI8_9PSEU